MKAILTIGLPGCGKSTWASQQEGFCVLERDIIRDVFFNIFSSPEKANEYYSSPSFGKREGFVSYVLYKTIEILSKSGRDIIIADTNLNRKFLSKLVKKLNGLGYDVSFKSFLDIPLDEVLRRNRNRKSSKVVPDEVIRSMYQRSFSIRDFLRT